MELRGFIRDLREDGRAVGGREAGEVGKLNQLSYSVIMESGVKFKKSELENVLKMT